MDFENSTLAFVDTLDGADFRDIAAHGDGTHLYAVGQNRLFVLRRDAENGALSLVLALSEGDGGDASGTAIEGLMDARTLAVDKRNRYLFVFGEQGVRALVFDLRDDPAHPRFLAGVRVQFSTSAPPIAHQRDQCYSAQVRNTVAAVDVFCAGFAYSVEVRPDGSVRQTEFLAPSQRDRFGRLVPLYDSGCGDGCVSTPGTSAQIGLASPDGKHLYAIYAKPQVVIFERVGSL